MILEPGPELWYARVMTMRPSLALAVAIVGLAATLMSACKPTAEQCEKACLHRGTLYLADKYEHLAEGKSHDELVALEARQKAELAEIRDNPDRGIKACVAACERPLRQPAVDCILRATTFPQVKECDE